MATTRRRFASACRRGGHLHRQWWWPGRLARSNGETTPSPPLSLSPPLAVGMALVAAVSSTLAAAGAAPPLGNAPSHGGFVAMLTSREFTSCFRLALPACTRLYPLTHPPLPLPPPHAFPHLTAWCGALAPFPSLPSNRVVPASDVLLVRCSHTSPPPPRLSCAAAVRLRGAVARGGATGARGRHPQRRVDRPPHRGRGGGGRAAAALYSQQTAMQFQLYRAAVARRLWPS